MARLAIGIGIGMVMTALGMAACQSHASSDDMTPTPSQDVQDAAAEAGVDAIDLQGAVYTTGMEPHAYLCAADGLLCPAPPVVPASSPGWPIGGATARVRCIESKESGGANVANRRGSGAVGVLQYMPSTFAAHAREMGHPDWSPWNPAQAEAVAAHDLALGRRNQWTVGGC
jgi:hypothetical protein